MTGKNFPYEQDTEKVEPSKAMDYLKTALLFVPLQNQNWSMQINITDPLPLTP